MSLFDNPDFILMKTCNCLSSFRSSICAVTVVPAVSVDDSAPAAQTWISDSSIYQGYRPTTGCQYPIYSPEGLSYAFAVDRQARGGVLHPAKDSAHAVIRTISPTVDQDRSLAADFEKLADLIRNGKLAAILY